MADNNNNDAVPANGAVEPKEEEVNHTATEDDAAGPGNKKKRLCRHPVRFVFRLIL